MEEHYIKDVGKITYLYGVNLEEHKTVIEKQQKRIAELEQELAELKEKAIVPKFKIGQEVWAVSVLRLNNIDSFIITEICYCADYGLYYKTNLGINLYEYYFDVFTTLEEAEKKLQELRNGDFLGE